MKELLLSPEAAQDLEQTWEFIAQDNRQPPEADLSGTARAWRNQTST